MSGRPTLAELVAQARAAERAAQDAERAAERAYKRAADAACVLAGVKWDRRTSALMPSEARALWAAAEQESRHA